MLSGSYREEQEINLELKVLVLNINRGYNEQLMSKCKRLREDGHDAGLKEGRIDMIRQMVLQNISQDTIMSVAKITEEELDKILKEN